ncbi:MAG: DUF21 domain-containing protein [Bacillota bacterium]
MEVIIWLGIFICLSQSAMFSGLNLAFFNISKLKLELEVEKGNQKAEKILELREDANLLLVTILWGNVAVNVLLSLLSNSILFGIFAFLFSTVVITIIGEIIPQAYCSRNAIKMAARLTPVFKFYQLLLFPVAKPTALLLDSWLGKEAITYYPEKDLRELVKIHMRSNDTEIQEMEGKGALNFLALDDLPIRKEGEPIEPKSIIQIEFEDGRPIFPEVFPEINDPFLRKVELPDTKWVILVDRKQNPVMALNSDGFIRDVLFNKSNFNPFRHCHRPIIVRDGSKPLDQVIPKLKVNPEHGQDDVVDEDIILLWSDEKKVITGSDILGRLLRGIVKNRAI